MVEDLVQQFANVGLTIFVIAMAWFLVNWLDRNIFK